MEPTEIPVNEESIVPLCCWCNAPLRLEGKIAWCSGSEECRKKQLACAVTVNGEILFCPSPRQADAMMATEPNVFVWGNRGGGKSVCMRWWAHMLASAIPGFRYIILRTSFPELQKNHLDYLEDEMNRLGGEARGFRFNKTEHVCRYPNGSIGYYAQCANDADVKKVLGAEVALVIFDEAPTFEWEHMRLIAGSIRVPVGSGMQPMTRYLGNPVGDSIDQLWSYFIDKDVDLSKDSEYRPIYWRAIEMRIEDNPYLDAKTYWRQFSGLLPHYIKAWREGIRVDENALFEFLPTLGGKPFHVVKEIPVFGDGSPLYTVDTRTGVYTFPPWVKIYRAMDHGFHPDPTVCLWFAVYGTRILCFRERTWYRTLPAQVAKEIKEDSLGMRVVTTFCDPSMDVQGGADVYTVMQQYENAGIPMDPQLNDREVFASATHKILGEMFDANTPRMQFLQHACPETIKYIPRMKFDEKHPAAMKAHKKDHWPVAFAYFAMTNIPTTVESVSTVPRRFQIPKRLRGAAAARLMERLGNNLR